MNNTRIVIAEIGLDFWIASARLALEFEPAVYAGGGGCQQQCGVEQCGEPATVMTAGGLGLSGALTGLVSGRRLCVIGVFVKLCGRALLWGLARFLPSSGHGPTGCRACCLMQSMTGTHTRQAPNPIQPQRVTDQ